MDLPSAVCDVRYGPALFGVSGVCALCLDVSGRRERIGNVHSMLDAVMASVTATAMAGNAGRNGCTLVFCRDMTDMTAIVQMRWKKCRYTFSTLQTHQGQYLHTLLTTYHTLFIISFVL